MKLIKKVPNHNIGRYSFVFQNMFRKMTLSEEYDLYSQYDMHVNISVCCYYETKMARGSLDFVETYSKRLTFLIF